MTDEAHGHNSEDAPARPASTRWSEDLVQDDAAQDDDGLAPPYVPGRRAPEAASSSSTATPSSTAPATSTSDDDFPFDEFDIDGDTGGDIEEDGGFGAPEAVIAEEAAAVDESAVTDDPGAEKTGFEEMGSETDDMGWSPQDLDDDVPFGQAEAEPEEGSYEDASFGEWTPGYEDDDPSAVDAELEPVADEAPVEEVEATEAVEAAAGPSEQEPDHRFDPDGSIESGPDARVEEVAAVLDRLSGLLRDEGEDAVRREMDSSDRLTALVSSLLSGHLSARR